MERTLIIGDVHGKHKELEELIREHTGPIVQLGDLCNCVANSAEDDLRCIEIAEAYIDVVLVGNHEYPLIAGNNHGFAGYVENQYVKNKIRQWFWSQYLQPAVQVGKHLVTHAGVHVSYALDQQDPVGDITARWQKNTRDPLFSDCGPLRGGRAQTGGILWSDWAEKKDKRFSQIVGHTHRDKLRTRGRSICIDFEPIGYYIVEGRGT